MVLFIGYHESSRGNRTSIEIRGLIASKPVGVNEQSVGVYVYNHDLCNDVDYPTVAWDQALGDLWRVVYCGPMWPDPLVRNAVILPSVTTVTLVTGNE